MSDIKNNDSFAVSPAEKLKGKADRDSLYRFLFDDKPIQGLWINVNKSLKDSLAHQSHYPLAIKKLFAELLLSATIFRYFMKGEGEVSFALRDSNISLTVSVGGENGQEVRCVASLNPQLTVADDAKLEDILDINARLVLSIMPKNAQSYQSIIEANLNSVEASFLDFYRQSVQIPAFFRIASTFDEEGNIDASAFFMQYIPDDSGTVEDFEDQVALATTLKNSELEALSAFDCCYRLFNQEKVTIARAKDFVFKCTCSEEKIKSMFVSLGEEEISRIASEEGALKASCNCCGQNYQYSEEEIKDYMEAGLESGVFVHKD